MFVVVFAASSLDSKCMGTRTVTTVRSPYIRPEESDFSWTEFRACKSHEKQAWSDAWMFACKSVSHVRIRWQVAAANAGCQKAPRDSSLLNKPPHHCRRPAVALTSLALAPLMLQVLQMFVSWSRTQTTPESMCLRIHGLCCVRMERRTTATVTVD